MLRRLKVRTRLIAVIAVPLVLLLAVAVPEALRRADRAEAADEAADGTADALGVMAAVEALQGERTLSAARRAGAPTAVETALRDQRASTDTALERVEVALDRLAAEAPMLAADVEVARDGIAGLQLARDATDVAESIVPWVDPFQPIIGSLIDLQEALGAQAADAGIGDDLRLAGLLARVKEATAAQGAQLAASATWAELRGDQAGILGALRSDEVAFRTAYLSSFSAEERSDRRADLARGPGTSVPRAVDTAISTGTTEAIGDLDDWLAVSGERQVLLRDLSTGHAEDARAEALALGEASERSATAYVALAGIGLLLALAVAMLAARSITRPLRRLTDAADHLAEERLPKLVEALRNPGADDERFLAATIEPIPVHSSDELGHLGRAFNAVQSVAVEVAAEQAELLRKGISDLYVNLARRNQSLIDRQIQLLDELEGGEQDPEVLEHLFLLDHLATRMRRNAESLLILAGAESGPHRSRPVGIVDAVRAAVSEVEEYERVELGSLAEATLHGPAVSDVAHLVAELLENATHFSPPETTVRVDGIRTGGSYQLVITDRGVGMRAEQLDELNAVLRDPPVNGLALGRSLGCLVAARLADRHDITVRLRPGEHEGIAAYVVLPRHLLIDEVADGLAPPVAESLLARTISATPTQEPWPVEWDEPEEEPAAAASSEVPATEPRPASAPLVPAPTPPFPAPPARPSVVPNRLSEVLPVNPAFDAGLQALLQGDAPPPRVEAAVPPPGGGGAASLPRRVPGATAAPAPSAPVDQAVRRSPDEVRAMLSRYRSGLQAGRSLDGAPEEDPT
jgi:HAMP domain-containing protein